MASSNPQQTRAEYMKKAINPFGEDPPQVTPVAAPANISNRIEWLFVIPQHKNSMEALELMKSVAAKAMPILNAHNWRIGTLTEWQVDDTDGAHLGSNANKGLMIFIRLRKFDDPSRLAPENEVLGVLLHELAHMEHEPHHTEFYLLLKELRAQFPGVEFDEFPGSDLDKLRVQLGDKASNVAFYDKWGLDKSDFPDVDPLHVATPSQELPQPQQPQARTSFNPQATPFDPRATPFNPQATPFNPRGTARDPVDHPRQETPRRREEDSDQN